LWYYCRWTLLYVLLKHTKFDFPFHMLSNSFTTLCVLGHVIVCVDDDDCCHWWWLLVMSLLLFFSSSSSSSFFSSSSLQLLFVVIVTLSGNQPCGIKFICNSTLMQLNNYKDSTVFLSCIGASDLRLKFIDIDIWYLFIYCNLVSTWWQWLVDLYKSRRDSTKGETIHKTIQKHRIHKTIQKHRIHKTENKKQTLERILKNTSWIIRE